jgi:hypothetical protein
MANKIFKGDIGTLIIVDLGTDVSTATTMEFHMVKPSGAKRIETLTAGDTNYEAEFTASSNSWTEVGTYTCQAYVEFGTDQYWGEIVKLQVYNPDGDANVAP